MIQNERDLESKGVRIRGEGVGRGYYNGYIFLTMDSLMVGAPQTCKDIWGLERYLSV